MAGPMPDAKPTHPVLLVILDGWGLGDGGAHDAIAKADVRSLAALRREHAYTTLGAAGGHVGLPDGQMGNSEVGHLNLGAGRLVFQEIVRINRAVEDGSFYENDVLVDAMERARDGRLHLVGLLGPGGVHSHQDHLVALVELAKRQGVQEVVIHHILDGRDTPPRSALDFAHGLTPRLDEKGVGRVVSVAGRYWTMDRDTRWERTRRGFELMTAGKGHRAASVAEAIEQAYARGEDDEFVEPTVVGDPVVIEDGDVVLCYNFRPDRMRQIVRMLADPDFDEVAIDRVDADVVTMTMYDQAFADLDVEVAFEPVHPERTWGAYYGELELRQLRIAETEKYAHVTYFFNGGVEDPAPGEDRKLVPSPQEVATYDEKPTMSAPAIADALLERLGDGYDLIVVNFANADMVGHTGRMEATVAACHAIDEALSRIVPAALDNGFVVAVTADHGNAEKMVDDDGRPQTAHTTSDVPFYVAMPDGGPVELAKGGALCDVAPTLLEIVGIEKPQEMTARSLWVRKTSPAPGATSEEST